MTRREIIAASAACAALVAAGASVGATTGKHKDRPNGNRTKRIATVHKGIAGFFHGIGAGRSPVPEPRAQPRHGRACDVRTGARSNWHTHPLGQTLIVVSGTGWTQCWGEAKQRLPGDRSGARRATSIGTAPPRRPRCRISRSRSKRRRQGRRMAGKGQRRTVLQLHRVPETKGLHREHLIRRKSRARHRRRFGSGAGDGAELSLNRSPPSLWPTGNQAGVRAADGT